MSIFKGPKKPAPPTPALPAPERSNEEIQAAAEEQRKKYGAGVGRSDTVEQTGGLGVPQDQLKTAAVRLLGGGV